MTELLTNPVQVHQAIENIFNWAESLELAVWSLDSKVENLLRGYKGQLKSLVVGDGGSQELCDLCSGARVSRLKRTDWPSNLLLARSGSQIRALAGLWEHDSIQLVNELAGDASDEQVADLVRLFRRLVSESRLAAGSPRNGETFLTTASPIDSLEIETLSEFASDEGFEQACLRLEAELKCVCSSVSLGGSSQPVLVARAETLGVVILPQGPARVLQLTSQISDVTSWSPEVTLQLARASVSGLTLAAVGSRLFLLFRDDQHQVATSNEFDRFQRCVLTKSPELSVGALLVGEVGRSDFLRRLADLTAACAANTRRSSVPEEDENQDGSPPLALADLSIEHYQEALEYGISPKSAELALALYNFPNSSATAIELTEHLGGKGHSLASFAVGRLGKEIAEYLGVVPPSYFNGKKHVPAYYGIVGPYYTDVGWVMNENMRLALEGLIEANSDEEEESESDTPLENFVPQFDPARNNYWIVKAKRSIFDLRQALAPNYMDGWLTGKLPLKLQAGDRVIFWDGNPVLSIVGIGEVGEFQREKNSDGQCPFDLIYQSYYLEGAPSLEQLRNEELFRDVSFLKAGPSGTLFSITAEQGRWMARELHLLDSESEFAWSDITNEES